MVGRRWKHAPHGRSKMEARAPMAVRAIRRRTRSEVHAHSALVLTLASCKTIARLRKRSRGHTLGTIKTAQVRARTRGSG